MKSSEMYTCTFAMSGENHVNNQILGDATNTHTLDVQDLTSMMDQLNSMETAKSAENGTANVDKTELFNIRALAGLSTHTGVPDAAVLVIKNGVDRMTNGSLDEAKQELLSKKTDKKYRAYGKVLNKKCRHNFMFGEHAQIANYDVGQGTVYPWDSNPVHDSLRKSLALWCKLDEPLLVGEVNHYYDTEKCYIGFHGDSERSLVVGARYGASEKMPLLFHCHSDGVPVGDTVRINLNDGDIYIMSKFAVGKDWKKRGSRSMASIHWRHAAGNVATAQATHEKKMKAKERKRQLDSI